MMLHFQSMSIQLSQVIIWIQTFPTTLFVIWMLRKGFIWLYYIPRGRGSLSDFFNQSSQIEVSIGSDFPVTSDTPNGKPKNEAGCSYENLGRLRRPIYPEQSSRDSIYLEDQHLDNQLSKSDLQEFDRSLVYNSCFPPSEILEWFNHRSGEPPVTIHLPPNLYDDSTWRGLALCVSFSVNIKDPTAILDILNSENAHHLYCHLESNVDSCSSFPDWLNQCSHAEASIVSDCPDLTVVKCGLRLVHQHDEEEFKQTTRHGLASLSDNWGLILHLTAHSRKRNKQNLSMLKEKGKHVLE
nr:hypothetical protein CFP56_49838 [Quercus suber]